MIAAPSASIDRSSRQSVAGTDTADAAPAEQGPIFAPDVDADYSGTPITAPYGDGGDLEAFFWANRTGDLIHKWHHYFPIYDRYLSKFRGRPVRFLEIGVFRGGSLAMWRDYLGPDAVIYGIDIDPRCAAFDGDHAQVRIGSQSDPDFLSAVVAEMGGIDVVIDDGSHISNDIRVSFGQLFPKLSDDGVYLVEDTHATYWPSYGGGHRHPGSFMTVVKDLMDDLHNRYHAQGTQYPRIREDLYGMHIHDSVVVLEKRTRQLPPKSSMTGIDRFGEFNVSKTQQEEGST